MYISIYILICQLLPNEFANLLSKKPRLVKVLIEFSITFLCFKNMRSGDLASYSSGFSAIKGYLKIFIVISLCDCLNHEIIINYNTSESG